MEEIHNDFTARNMDSTFIKSSMSYKALECLKQIDRHGVLKGVNSTSVSKETKKWSKKV